MFIKALFLKNSILVMSILMSVTSCKKDDTKQSAVQAEEYINVSYGMDSAQKMDIYLPENRNTGSTKVMILIHGGAWMEGDKVDFVSYITSLKKKLPDYAFININYRLATQIANHFPAQENDVQSAIEFVNKKRAEYLISDKFILLGASAGGHLALLQAYKHTNLVKVKAVVSFFGPSDLVDLYNSQSNSYYQYGFQLLIGGTPVSNPSIYQQSSPLYFAGVQSCPTLLLHGGKDPLVPSAESVTLKNKLTASGVKADVVIYPSEGHGWYGTTLEDSFNKIKDFLTANVQ
jgi:acetyl esterase/lipase